MKILWGRILIFAFTFEVLAILLLGVVTTRLLNYPMSHLEISCGLFIGSVLVGIWLGKKAPSNPILNGAVFGIATVVLYVAITGTAELAGLLRLNYDFYYYLKHIVKILGGALGGIIAMNLAKRQVANEANC